MANRNFFAELKRRNVYKVAIAYIVASWLLIQAASIFLPAFDAPASAMKILVVLLVLGFPIALAFSWARSAVHCVLPKSGITDSRRGSGSPEGINWSVDAISLYI